MRTRNSESLLSIACALLAGCAWYRGESSCTENTTSCKGDDVRECTVDSQASTYGNKPKMHWETTKRCGTDDALGKYTCGMVQGRATCVQAPIGGGVDGGVAEGPVERPWLRVDVSRDADGGMRLKGVQEVGLTSSPVESTWGAVAAVGMDGTTVVDATLVPFTDDSTTGTSVWLEGAGVDGVSIQTSDGTVLDAFTNPNPAAADAGADDGAPSAPLDDSVPMGLAPGVLVRVQGASTEVPTQAMRDAVDKIFARIPTQLTYPMRELLLVADAASETVEAKEEDALAPIVDAGTASLPPLLPSSDASELFVRHPFREASWALDMRASTLRGYASETTLASRQVAIVMAAEYVSLAGNLNPDPFVRKSPDAFPKQIADYLTNHLGPLLAAGENLASAWNSLHGVAVDALLAYPYSSALGVLPPPKSAEEAVAHGFASVAGFKSVENDVSEYLAAALVPERWPARPCDAIRAQALDEIAPALLVHVAKLIALRGLGLIGGPELRVCTGAFRIANPDVQKSGGIVMHKPDGTRIPFTGNLEGIYQPYFDDELQLSWKADREYAGLSVSAGFRGAPPGVLRFSAGSNGNEDAPINRAVLALTNPDGYQTSLAKGGLLTLDAVRPDALTAYGLMVVLTAAQAGTKIFPLVSAQVKQPVWGDAP